MKTKPRTDKIPANEVVALTAFLAAKGLPTATIGVSASRIEAAKAVRIILKQSKKASHGS